MSYAVFSGGGASVGGSRFNSSFGAYGNFATSAPVYSQPAYLMRAAKRKYGPDIMFIGAEESQLNQFWSKVEIKASNFLSERPQEVSRAIVDITAKEHVNKGTEPDTIDINNTQTESRSQKKAYSLTFEKNWEFGASVDVGASFFNILGSGGPSLGLGGSAKHSRTTTEDTTKEEERSLSQQYGVTGKMTVAPKSKIKVEITTYTVNYKIGVRALFSAPATASIPIYYKKGIISRLLCCSGTDTFCRKTGFITAEELFQMENDYYNENDTTITFAKDTELSYLCETVEMHKEESPITTTVI